MNKLLKYNRRDTNKVYVGNIPLGKGEPVRLQSMTNTDTSDIEATFYANSILTYNNISVTIQETTIQRGNDANGWYEQILSINYVRNIS